MLKLYNTLSRKKEVFKPFGQAQAKPLKDKEVRLFVCGPTVYDFSHLGHARTYVVYDMFVRYLRFLGYNVFYLQNITDIDDKIIQRAKEKNIAWDKLSRDFEKEYFEDMKSLKIESITEYARATEHIKEIQSQVKRLLGKGLAYEIADGIYYDISKFKEYGKLSGRTALQAEDAVSRIDEATEKRNKGDFCLWKYSQPDEPQWKSPWKPGRPGWHIEDTAIAEKYLGFQYDIHGGARDLIFPHHEAEIAQMEGISGRSPMVKYWIHTGFLTVNGQKMSKSLGNFITIKDFLKKYPPEVLRFIVFSSHYRSPVDFSDQSTKEAKANLEKLEDFLKRIKQAKKKAEDTGGAAADRVWEVEMRKFEQDFWQALEDDFNTPKAKGLLFDFVSRGNKELFKKQISEEEARQVYQLFEKINNIFDILNFEKIEKQEKIPKKVLELAKKREKLRKQKQWQKADELRQEISKLGYQVDDTDDGSKIKPKQ